MVVVAVSIIHSVSTGVIVSLKEGNRLYSYHHKGRDSSHKLYNLLPHVVGTQYKK